MSSPSPTSRSGWAPSRCCVNDIVLLVAVVFHGLNGVRMVALDYGFAGAGARRALSAVLIALGVAAIAFGIWALWVWVS